MAERVNLGRYPMPMGSVPSDAALAARFVTQVSEMIVSGKFFAVDLVGTLSSPNIVAAASS